MDGRVARWAPRCAMAAALVSLAMGSALADEEEGSVPGAIPDPSTYQGSMELQRQEQEQQQPYQPTPSFGAPGEQRYPGSSSAGGSAYAARPSPADEWRRRPPLPPQHNALLGRWHPLGAVASPTANGQVGNLVGQELASALDDFIGGALGGACDSMFGRGVIEFAEDALLAIDRDGRSSVLNHVQYRGDGSAVAVLPTDPDRSRYSCSTSRGTGSRRARSAARWSACKPVRRR